MGLQRVTDSSKKNHTFFFFHFIPDCKGDKVVFVDNRRGEIEDIRLMDLATGAETAITSGTNDHYTPAIFADRIVFSDMKSIYLAVISGEAVESSGSGPSRR